MTGCLIMKLSKMTATALGGTLTLLQIGHHKGYKKWTGIRWPNIPTQQHTS
jgi:hypothetical protein